MFLVTSVIFRIIMTFSKKAKKEQPSSNQVLVILNELK